MRTFRTTLTAVAVLVLFGAVSASATYPIIKGISLTATLGSAQMAKTIEYTGARMTSKHEIVYTAKVDGQARNVIYALSPSTKSVTVTVTGGSTPLGFKALVNNEVIKTLNNKNPDLWYSLALMSGGATIATAREAGSGMATGRTVTLNYGNGVFDRLSMDVLLHLPSEFTAISPQVLFKPELEQESPDAVGVGKVLLDILTLGIKYDRDCESTKTGPSYSCSAVCTNGDSGDLRADCPCSMCGPICCSSGCTVTEGTTTRNCTAVFSIGK